mmetsp:Transcript_45298/g.95031  ORF Transcript_45298/g.95031 Transcript_45298/m.95031 type:complete len:471 (-) Transcript_45298:235-1647(-)
MKTAATLYSLTLLTVEATTNTRGGTTPPRRRRLDMEGAVTDLGHDSYATAWRYLGAYLDCRSSSSFAGYVSSKFSSACKYCRRREMKSCKNPTRRLLWAAYYDPNYSGEEIGEYQYYDSDDGAWDDSTCTGNRCNKMDCHNPNSSTWKLLGVYKETVSFDDDNFYEQLFKHQGYCLWDGDKDGYDYDSQDNDAWESGSTYGFMQAMRKELPEGCTETSVFSDGTYYIDMKPQSKGDMTLGVYKDSGCTEESKYTYEDYQSYASSSLTASGASGAFDTWNSGMDAYKICQPCRAYNKEETEVDENWKWDRRRRHGRRQLGEENDGQGDEEKNGYNCYDDAGYQNCNQCYKFETHTDMQQASGADLQAASSQGTILRIQYDGVWYGHGNVDGSSDEGGDGGSSSGHSFRYSSNAVQFQYQYSRTSYSFAGIAVLALGAAAVRVRKRRRGTLDGDIDDVGDGEDAYVEMAAPR